MVETFRSSGHPDPEGTDAKERKVISHMRCDAPMVNSLHELLPKLLSHGCGLKFSRFGTKKKNLNPGKQNQSILPYKI